MTFVYTLGTVGHTGPHHSITHTMDPAHAGNVLDSIVFVDGLGRTIQRKVELVIDYGPGATVAGHAVSGPFVRDSLGRITHQYQSFFEQFVPFDSMITAPPAVNPTQVEFDVFGRVKKVRSANGTDTLTFTHGYSPTGVAPIRRTSSAVFARAGSTPDTRTTLAERDMSGNLRRLEQSNTVGGVVTPVVTTYDYDLLGRLTAVHDASGNSTTAQYDSLDRMIALTDPDSGLVTYEYNLAGDLGARVTPQLRNSSQKIFYDYDHGRLWRIRYPTTAPTMFKFGAVGDGFNRVGRLYEVTDASGSRELQFTPNGEVSFESRTLAAFGTLSTPTTAEMSFEYDSLGRATSVTYPSLDGQPAETVRYGYDTAGNLSNVIGEQGSKTRSYIDSITYDRFGRRKRVTFGNGPTGNRVTTEYQYDDVEQRLTGIDTNTPFGQIQKLRYQYTAHGLVSAVTNEVASSPMQGPMTATFEYDQLEQLVRADGLFKHDDGSQRRYSLEMSYDVAGRTQRMNQQDELLGGSGTWTPVAQTTRDAWYTYAAGRRHRAESIGTSTFTYDLNGNQLQETRASGATRHFEWDEEDRLLAVSDGSKTTAEFRYDSGGTRTHKTAGSTTTVYPSAFITVRNGTEVTRHIYAAGQRVSSVFSDSAGDRVYWSHGDAQGSAHYTTNANGQVHEHAEHLPFGEGWVQQSSGMDVGSQRFHGHELDGETGLHYVGARYYDPRTTRWLSTDPALPEYVLGDGVGDPRNLMTYGYVYNSPANYVDPDGRTPVPPRPESTPPGFRVVKLEDGRYLYIDTRVTTTTGYITRTPSVSAAGAAVTAGAAVARALTLTAPVQARAAGATGGLSQGAVLAIAAGAVVVVGTVIYATAEPTITVSTNSTTAPPAQGGGGQGGSGSSAGGGNRGPQPDPNYREIARQVVTVTVATATVAAPLMQPAARPGLSNAPMPSRGVGLPSAPGAVYVPSYTVSLPLQSPSIAPITAGRNFRRHFLDHWRTVQDALGGRFGSLTSGGGDNMLRAITDAINSNRLQLVGRGTIRAGGDTLNVYRGQGITVLTTQSGEFVTALESGQGMDLSIRFVP